MLNGKKILVVLPAYNAAATSKKPFLSWTGRLWTTYCWWTTTARIETVRLARGLNIRCFLHDRNYGYGRNQKTCYTEALKSQADVIVMLHRIINIRPD